MLKTLLEYANIELVTVNELAIRMASDKKESTLRDAVNSGALLGSTAHVFIRKQFGYRMPGRGLKPKPRGMGNRRIHSRGAAHLAMRSILCWKVWVEMMKKVSDRILASVPTYFPVSPA